MQENLLAIGAGYATVTPWQSRNPIFKENIMAWSKPQATDLRFGFEITMYIANR